MKKNDVIIVGAGAAGLMCGIEAGKRGRTVLVLEHAARVGEKIRISGGGRCNFTNKGAEHSNFLSGNPHFSKSALARFTPSDFTELVERHRIAYHEKKLGQLFCDGTSRQIVDMLLKECDAAGVEIRVECAVNEITKDGYFTLQTNRGVYESSSLVVATGGLSVPQLGATNFGYRIAAQFGLQVTPLNPGLVPLTIEAGETEFFSQLSGIGLDVRVSCNGMSFRENMLFTHRGVSGPAILQISSYWRAGDAIVIDLLPDIPLKKLLQAADRSQTELKNFLGKYLPKRLADAWCARSVPSKPLSRFSSRELAAVADHLHNWSLRPAGTAGFGKAEVTVGGVDTDELSSKTMEAKKIPGLYFIGEVVDVTGWLGGYNFQWAWASGFVAGRHV